MYSLVSILALCFNHENFLEEALQSIDNLTYPNLEIWIADDSSADSSPQILMKWKARKPEWNFVLQENNQGNCKTFNHLLAKCKGKWVIDFATDDLFEPNALQAWVEKAESVSGIGFCYADGIILQQESGKKNLFSNTIRRATFPEGKILPELLNQPFICSPAVLFRTDVLKEMGGYDESLSYEDWDAWLRLAQKHPVCYHNLPVITYRRHAASLSSSLLLKRNRKILQSTALILNRISDWPEFKSNPEILAGFTRYHLRLGFGLQLPEEAREFYQILKRNQQDSALDWFLNQFSGSFPWVYPLYKSFQIVKNQLKMKGIG